MFQSILINAYVFVGPYTDGVAGAIATWKKVKLRILQGVSKYYLTKFLYKMYCLTNMNFCFELSSGGHYPRQSN